MGSGGMKVQASACVHARSNVAEVQIREEAEGNLDHVRVLQRLAKRHVALLCIIGLAGRWGSGILGTIWAAEEQ